jgi:hypothetical protein
VVFCSIDGLLLYDANDKTDINVDNPFMPSTDVVIVVIRETVLVMAGYRETLASCPKSSHLVHLRVTVTSPFLLLPSTWQL